MSNQTHALAGVGIAVGLTLAGLAWVATHSGTVPPVTPAQAPSAGGRPAPPGILSVSAQQAAQLGIRLAAATGVDEVPLASIPAMIQPPANARVAVAATFPGVVMRTLVVEGDIVRQGQPLAVISSREVLTMGADLARANARSGVARSNAARLSQLAREGIIAGARAEEANAVAAEANADVSEKARILRMVNGHGGKGTYTLTAPIAGRVTAASVQAGNPVDGTTAPYVIDAADRYEIAGQLPERLMGTVRPGMNVRVNPDIVGRIIAVGTTIDPATRSASLKAQIPAGAGIITGRATTITVLGPAPAGAVSIPTAAVTVIGGKTVVFVTAPDGFARREVMSGGTAGDKTVLLSGVKPGERVVTQGTSALKSLASGR